jgi:hypothetical protein
VVVGGLTPSRSEHKRVLARLENRRAVQRAANRQPYQPQRSRDLQDESAFALSGALTQSCGGTAALHPPRVCAGITRTTPYARSAGKSSWPPSAASRQARRAAVPQSIRAFRRLGHGPSAAAGRAFGTAMPPALALAARSETLGSSGHWPVMEAMQDEAMAVDRRILRGLLGPNPDQKAS